MTETAECLAAEIRRVVGEELEGLDRVGIMFSGGLDSSVLAILARKHCDVMLYTLGNEKSHDSVWSAECAHMIDLPLTLIRYSEKDVRDSLGNVILKHGMTRARWVSTFVAFDLALRNIREGNVICGQGADEAFGGYRKYTESPDPRAQMDSDISALVEEEMPEYRKMAGHYGKSLIAPFLEPGILGLAAAVPANQSLGPEGNKLVLREAAEIIGVPGMMATRPKKAMQYGSGVSAAIKRILKDSGTDLDSFINSLVQMGACQGFSDIGTNC